MAKKYKSVEQEGFKPMGMLTIPVGKDKRLVAGPALNLRTTNDMTQRRRELKALKKEEGRSESAVKKAMRSPKCRAICNFCRYEADY